MEKFEDDKDLLASSGKKGETKEITKEEARQKMAKKYGLPEDATWGKIIKAVRDADRDDEPVNKEK